MKTLWLLLAMLLGLNSPQVEGVNTSLPKNDIQQIGDFAYGIINVSDLNKLSLIPNYGASDSSQTIFNANHCVSAISGGFYGEDKRPLGLLVVDGQILNRSKQSALFDGFISLDENAQIDTKFSPSAQTVLQTGPILIHQNTTQNLQIKSDKSARRMVAAIADSNLYFLTIYNSQAEVLGPYLADLPNLVEDISKKENLQFDNAINLDGGRASAFYSPSLTLAESDPVGSVFCVK